MNFIRIAGHIYPTERIKEVKLGQVRGRQGLIVSLFDVPGTFDYDGDGASQAWDLLETFTPASAGPVTSITIDGSEIIISEIEWVDLAADFAGKPVVELRTRQDGMDAQGNPVVRRYIDVASQAYDILLAALTPQSAQTAS